MPYEARWLVDKRVLYIKYTGIIGKDEIEMLNGELATFLEDGKAPIHIISDNIEMERLSADLKTFRTVFTSMRDERWGWIMLIGADPITNFFGQLVTHAFRLKLRMVKTFDEATYALEVEDSSLEGKLKNAKSQ